MLCACDGANCTQRMDIMQMGVPQNYAVQSLSEVTVTYIKDKILSGEYKCGDKLFETEISAALQVSRAPVREAMRQLNVEGIILFSPRKGNYVRDMALEEIQEVFEIRITLEKQVIERLINQKMLKKKDFARLQSLIDAMKAQESKPLDLPERIYQLNSLDLQFHSCLWDASRSFQRGRILVGLFFQLLIAMNRETLTLGNFTDKATEHQKMLTALQQGDLENALAGFEEHLLAYREAITAYLQNNEAAGAAAEAEAT